MLIKYSQPKYSISQAYQNINISSSKTRLYKDELDPFNKQTKTIDPISLDKNPIENNKEKIASQSNDNIINNETKDINNINKNNNLLKFRDYLIYLISLF